MADPRTRSFPDLLPLPVTLVLLGLLALLPRVFGLVDFMTTDEVYNWLSRVERFSGAVASGQWGATVLVGHPGVTLCWLASLGLAAERFALAQGWATVASQVEYLSWLRMPLAIFESLSVPVAYLLLRRLVAPATALIAAVLWATSPYLIAHGRLLHLDALLTTFVTFCLLCVLIGCRSARPRRWMVAAGICEGLALLTKGPALIMLPFIGLLLFALADNRQPTTDDRPNATTKAPGHQGSRIHQVSIVKNLRVFVSSWFTRLRVAIPLYLIWLAVAALTFGLVWPAMWVDPGHALRAFFGLIFQNGGRPNGDGQFFLGKAVGDPGALFYVVADLFRMTPVMLLGLLGALVQGSGVRGQGSGRLGAITQNSKLKTQHFYVLLAFVLFWSLVMTLGPKKFDRYTLPTWPALLVLAAAGWRFWLWDVPAWFQARRPGRGVVIWPKLRGVVLLGLLAAELVPLAQYQPYYLSYYNPLLGGGAAAQRALLIGWGEGMDQVGAYLRTRPDIANGPVISALPRTLRPFVPTPVNDVIDLGDTPVNYAVVYLESIQRNASPAIYARIRQTLPLHRITIHGIDYAEIYQLPRPFALPIDARFGDALVLRGVTITPAPGQLTVTPAWDVRAQPAADYLAFIHVLDPAGRTIAQIDVGPGGGDTTTSNWQPGQQIAAPLPLPLPSDLPKGAYQVTLGLYDPKTGQRLPIAGGTAADPAVAGPNALMLDTLTLP